MSKNTGFRCPENILEEIEQKITLTGKSKSEIIIEMIKGLPSVEIEKRKTLPNAEAVYVVWALDKILYIGQTKDLCRRFNNHHRLVEFLNCDAKIAWFDAEGSDRLEIESDLIEAFCPELNWASIENEQYAIVDPDLVVDGDYQNAIVGSISAKSKLTAKKKAIELTCILNPIIAICSILSDADRAESELAPILWVQPEGNPKTDNNLRGGGKVKTKVLIDIKAWVSPEIAERFKAMAIENKSAWIADAIEAKLNMESCDTSITRRSPEYR
jgi:hypothetical protein